MNNENNNSLAAETAETVRDMFIQDIATIARQACDLRHPVVTVQIAEVDKRREFYATFGERLNSNDHKELLQQMQETWGDSSVSFKRIGKDTIYSILLTVEI